jgi:glyoxylase-like metal-dependent hydrolase (beta-lactamase superfamily II)
MKTLKTILKWFGIIALILVATGVTLFMIYVRPVMTKMQQTEVIKYDSTLTLVIGGGGNSGILVSDSLVIVIDTKFKDAAEVFAKQVKDLAGSKPILVINTHYHPDHCEGNKFYKGQSILAGGNYNKEIWLNNASEETMPTQWLKDKMDIKMRDDTVTIYNFNRNAHTESDVFVYLHKRKILFGGDVILNGQVPVVRGSADPDGYMDAYNRLPKLFDIQKIVPGHGPLGGLEVIEKMKQYFIDMQMAATDDSKKAVLVAKYNDWTQVPILMSPGATISALKKRMESK